MFFAFEICCIVILANYVILIFLFYLGWKRLRDFHVPTHPAVKLSVLVAARNEQDHIGSLLSGIASQSYPKNLVEVILIDDSSEDATIAEAEKFSEILQLKIVRMKEHTGKKKALRAGVETASGDLIVTTDADCRVPSRWLETIAAFYEAEKPSMIIGPVVMEPGKGFFAAFQALDFASLVASGAGAAGIGRPFLCNGANLAYPRQEFINAADPLSEKIASGDDVLFLQKLKKTKGKKILFLKAVDAIVTTNTENKIKAFFSQRIRWTSKTKFSKDAFTIYTAFSVLLINLMIVLSAGYVFVDYRSLFLLSILWGLKAGVDFLLLSDAVSFLGKGKMVWYFFPAQIVYPFYVAVVGVLGNSIRFSWKGKAY